MPWACWAGRRRPNHWRAHWVTRFGDSNATDGNRKRPPGCRCYAFRVARGYSCFRRWMVRRMSCSCILPVSAAAGRIHKEDWRTRLRVLCNRGESCCAGRHTRVCLTVSGGETDAMQGASRCRMCNRATRRSATGDPSDASVPGRVGTSMQNWHQTPTQAQPHHKVTCCVPRAFLLDGDRGNIGPQDTSGSSTTAVGADERISHHTRQGGISPAKISGIWPRVCR